MWRMDVVELWLVIEQLRANLLQNIVLHLLRLFLSASRGKGTANASWYTFQSQAYYSIEFQDWLLKGYFIMQCAYGRLPDH